MVWLPENAVQKAIRNLSSVPVYIKNQLLSKIINSDVERTGDFVQFTEGGYAARINSRPQFASNIFYDYLSFKQAVENVNSGISFDSGLEIGCGYGRLTPFFGLHTDEMIGLDPNRDALKRARYLYPNVNFIQAPAQEIPLSNDSVDLLITWTVLHHIPPEESLEAIGEEMTRVLSENGMIIICEKVRGTDG